MDLAKSQNLRATQADLTDRTAYYRRMLSPRLSLAGGRSIASLPIMR